jgi:hypothetical protein
MLYQMKNILLLYILHGRIFSINNGESVMINENNLCRIDKIIVKD